MKKSHLVLLIFLYLSVFASIAQTDSTVVGKEKIWWKKGKPYVIITNDGTEYLGEIVGDNDREILINTKTMGKLYIPKYAIKSVELLDSSNFSNGEFIEDNNHPHYYMAATNVLPYKKGELRLTMFYFGGYSGTYAINENVMLGVHTTLIGAPMGVSLKTSFMMSDKNYVGTDMHIGSLTYLQKSSYVGSVAAKYTHGDDHTNFTLMGGIGFASILRYKYINSVSTPYHRNDNSYYFNASLFHRLTKNAGFTAEGWIIPKNNFGLAGIGIRTMKKKDASWVFGFYNLIFQDKYGYNNYSNSSTTIFIPIPYFGATFRL